MLARLDHVRVADQGVVARALIAERDLRLGEEPRPRLGPEPGEGGRPLGQRQRPELVGRQVDIVRTGNRHDPAFPRTCSYFTTATRTRRSRGFLIVPSAAMTGKPRSGTNDVT